MAKANRDITDFFRSPSSKRQHHDISDSESAPSETDESPEPPETINSESTSADNTSSGGIDDRDPCNGNEGAIFTFKRGLGPYQPTNVCFPPNRKGRRFQSKWYNSFKWLEYSPKLDKAFCFGCRLFGQTGQYDDAFVLKGFYNWKDALHKFCCHEKSIAHITAAEKWLSALEVQKNPDRDVHFQLNQQHRAEVQENRQYIKFIVETLQFLGRQRLAFRGHRENEKSLNKGNFLELLQLRARDNAVISQFLAHSRKHATYTSHDIQNTLLEIMANNIQEKILIEIKAATFYGLILDETQDIARQEQVALVLRYVTDAFIIKERFIGFFRVTATDGESLYNLIKAIFLKLGLEIQNIVAQCYDGASNMRGGYKGVATRVKNDNHKAIYVHCCGHVLNLALVDTAKQITPLRNTLGIISQLHTFINGSAKRHAVFESLQTEAGFKTITLKSLSDTRWSCRAEALKAVKKRIEELINTLDEIADSDVSNGAEAHALSKSISTFDFVFNLYILDAVFSMSNLLSKYLQAVGISISLALEKVFAVCQSLRDMRSDSEFDNFWQKSTDICTKLNLEEPSLPRQRRVPHRLGGGASNPVFTSVQQYYKVNCFYPLIDTLTSQIEQRFQENDLKIVKDTEEILTATSMSAVSSEAVSHVSSFYSIDQDDLKAELRVFINLIKEKEKEADSVMIARMEVISGDSSLRTVFPIIFRLFKIFWTIPINSCSAERSFSCLRDLKDYLRSTMKQERLSSLALLALERDITIDIDNVIDIFAKDSPRRLNLL